MFIDSTTLKRVNIHHAYKGFSRLDTPEIRERAGVIEIPEPAPPADYSEDTYYRTEQDDAPYVTYTKKSDEQIAAVRWNKLKAHRDNLLQSGGCQVGTHWFHSDLYSKMQQSALRSAGASLPAGIMWKTMDGSFVEMTPELAEQIFWAQLVQEQTIFTTAEAKKLDDTPISEGWPATYQETLNV